MSDYNYEVAPLDIPERCQSCPALNKVNRDFLVHRELQRKLLAAGEVAMAGMPEGLKAIIENHLNDDLGEELAAHNMTASQATTMIEVGIRQEAGDNIQEADETVERIRNCASAMIYACDGPLTMRASRNGVEQKVTICTSTAPNPYSNAALVTRQRKS